MTYEEAIEWLESVTPYYDDEEEVITIAIECIKKQMPKKPKVKEWIAIDEAVHTYHCPCCGVDYNRFYVGKPYCMYCSQAMDWSDEE